MKVGKGNNMNAQFALPRLTPSLYKLALHLTEPTRAKVRKVCYGPKLAKIRTGGKFTEDEVRSIRLKFNGRNLAELAREFGVSKDSIKNITYGGNYAWVI